MKIAVGFRLDDLFDDVTDIYRLDPIIGLNAM
jgi:hypothetical protein